MNTGSELAKVTEVVEAEFEERPAPPPGFEASGDMRVLLAQLEAARVLYIDNDPAVVGATSRYNKAERSAKGVRKKAARDAAAHAARMESLRASTAMEEARTAAAARFDQAMAKVGA